MKRSVVVTGASTGIGLATAKMLVANGFHVFGSVRRMDDADRLAADIGEEVTPLIFDVTDDEAVREAARDVGQRLGDRRLAGLVNNAGIATPGPLLHLPLKDLRWQLEVNVVGQVGVTQAFAPLLGADAARNGPPGRIVNMSSVAGKLVSPFAGAYAASKHALEALSDALRRELAIYGIDVVVIEPGTVATPIWDKAEALDVQPYLDTDYRDAITKMLAFMLKRGRSGYPPDKVAEAVLLGLTAPKPPIRIPVVQGAFENWIAPRLMSDRMLDNVIAKRLGLKKPA